MTQVMYFWKYPTTPPPNAPSNIAYNFASMPLNKQAANLLPAAGEMQRLIHDCGLALQTSYGPTESGTAPDNIGIGFYSMHYGSYSQTNSLSQQAWSGADDGTTYATLLTNEIQTNKRPCIVSGFTIYHSGPLGTFPNPGGDGHSWVCDGSNVTTYYFGTTNTYVYNGIYTTTTTYTSSQSVSLLHMNWGWENPYAVGQLDQQGNVLTNNGWYDCSVNYTQSGSANGDENFQYFQIVNYNIHP